MKTCKRTDLVPAVLTWALVLLASASGFAGSAECSAVGGGGESPSVLIIMCDQLNARVLGCYGGPVPTPNIDRIAREGVRFTDATCPTPFCSPTRATIVTGMYPHGHGITYNVMRRDYPMVKSPPTQEGIKVSDVTTEGILHAAGYATHHYGKWHLSDDDLPYYTDMYTEHGAYAEEMAATFAGVREKDASGWMDWYRWALPVEVTAPFQQAVQAAQSRWGRPRYLDFVAKMGRLTLPLEQNFDVRVADRTVERIRAVGTRPLMITCSFNAPHDPNVVPSPYYEMFDPAEIRLPQNRSVREPRHESSWSRQMVTGLGETGLREFLRVYYASVKLVDDQVGRILDALEQSGRLDRTVVVFTADHGDMAGGHGMTWKSNGSFYDEIVLVPLLVRYPPLLPPQRSGLAVDLTDLMPTLLEIARQPIPDQAQGQSLVPYLTGRRDALEARPYSFCERVRGNRESTREVRPGTPASLMVRGQGWKYVRYPDGDEYLYHLEADPGETENLAKRPDCEPQKRRMIEALEAWRRRTGWEE
jgi:arylsulfatase A-like enzyme